MKSLHVPRFLPVAGDSCRPPGTTVMISLGQIFSHILQPMHASSPCSLWTSAKLARYRDDRSRVSFHGSGSVFLGLNRLRRFTPRLSKVESQLMSGAPTAR